MVCITSWIQEYFTDLCEVEKVKQRKKDIKRSKGSKAHGLPTYHISSQWMIANVIACPASCLSRIIPPRGTYHGALQVFTFVDLPGTKPRITEKKVRGQQNSGQHTGCNLLTSILWCLIKFGCRFSALSIITSWCPTWAPSWEICPPSWRQG